MLALERLAQLKERKRALLQASEVQRQILVLECAVIHHRLNWVDRTVSLAQRLLPLASWLRPLLGAWSARRADGHRSWLGTLVALLPLARQAAGWWQEFTRKPAA